MRHELPTAAINLRNIRLRPKLTRFFMNNLSHYIKLEVSSSSISEARLITLKYPHHVIDGPDTGVSGIACVN